MNPAPIIIALGGNAISRKGEEGNIEQQFGHSQESAEPLADLIASGRQLIITHGNGPQVGNILRRVELSASEIYPIPLHLCVADTQAGMGHMIAQCVSNALARRGCPRRVHTIITHVEVDPHDLGFSNPTKPIGRPVPAERARQLSEKYGWQMREIGSGDWRRVVASPLPRRILEVDLFRKLVADGELLVVAGGGGIAVEQRPGGETFGLDCVIDKDRTSALLAVEIGAPLLLIATGVDKVAIDYGTPRARALDRMTLAEARHHLAAGQFPEGTMGPKIEAALNFLERSPHPAPRVIISALESMSAALDGRAGTHITR